jgi:heat shock 70kDa protein 1/2/6/8
VTFNVDANGILSVNAREESTGKSKNIKIKNEKGRLNKSEIDKMVSEAEKFKEDDEKCKQRVSSRNLLESYLFSVRAALKEYGSKLVEQEQTQLEKLINENIFWLENNRERDAALYEEKFKDLQRVIIPVMNKFNKKNEQDGPKIEEVN